MTWADPEPALVRPSRRRALAPIVVPQVLTVVLAVGALTYFAGDEAMSDEADRVTVSVPRSWTDQTAAAAEVWDDDERGPALAVGNFLGDRHIDVVVAPRTVELARRHAADVDRLCSDLACVSRGQPAAVEVNGRPGVQQVLAHAGAEWTVLLTLESAEQLVAVTGRASEFAGPDDVDALQAILRTVVLSR
jgi:hypothetical protein